VGLAGFLIAGRLREQEEDSPHLSQQAPPTSTTPLMKVLLRRTTVVILLTSTIAAGGRGLGVLNAYVPSYLSDGAGLGAISVGVVFSILLAGSIIGPLLEGHVADRLGAKPVILASYVLGAIAMVVFGLSGAYLGVLVVSGALMGLFAYAETPLLQALFADATQGADQRAAFGIFFAIAYGIGSVWTLVIGYVIDSAGFEASFLVMAGSFVAAGLVLLFLDETPPKPALQAA